MILNNQVRIRKNGRTEPPKGVFKAFLHKVFPNIVFTTQDGPMPDDYDGIYVLNSLAESEESPQAARILTLAHQAADKIEAAYPSSSTADTYRASATDRALYVEHNGDVVSFIVWIPFYGDAWIGMVWTHPDHREQGLYRALYERLQIAAIELGLTGIACGVAGDNEVSKAVHESLGMIPTSITYSKAL